MLSAQRLNLDYSRYHQTLIQVLDTNTKVRISFINFHKFLEL